MVYETSYMVSQHKLFCKSKIWSFILTTVLPVSSDRVMERNFTSNVKHKAINVLALYSTRYILCFILFIV